jgi:hypothetical protein
MSYAPTFEEALAGLVGRKEAPVAAAPAAAQSEKWNEARGAFERYLTATSEGRFAEAGRALEELREVLMTRRTSTPPGG